MERPGRRVNRNIGMGVSTRTQIWTPGVTNTEWNVLEDVRIVILGWVYISVNSNSDTWCHQHRVERPGRPVNPNIGLGVSPRTQILTLLQYCIYVCISARHALQYCVRASNHKEA